MSFTRLVRFEPGYNCKRFECRWGHDDCKPGSDGYHGIHGLNIRFVLRGEKGAVQFLLYTGWLPEPKASRDIGEAAPFPTDLGYHSLAPRYKGQNSMGPCEFLDGADCYSDGSSLNANEPFRVLCNEGDEALWAFLEAYYGLVFEGIDFPEAKSYLYQERNPHDRSITRSQDLPL